MSWESLENQPTEIVEGIFLLQDHVKSKNIYNLEFVQPYTTIYEYYNMSMFFASSPAVSSLSHCSTYY